MGSQTEMVFGIITLAIIIVVGATILSNYQEAVLTTNSTSTTQTILADNGSAQTLSNEPITGTLATTRKNMTWLSFDGSNDNIELSPSPVGAIFFDDNFTYSIWINSSDTVSPLDSIYSSSHVILGIRSGVLYMYARNQTSSGYNITYQGINDSAWHHIVGVQFNNGSGLNYSLYVDGVKVNNSYIDGLYHTSSTPTVFFSAASSAFAGSADEIRFYHDSNVLSNSQISEIYNSGRQANTSLVPGGLNFWLPINENSGTNIHSINETLSSTTFSGAISGATWQNDGINLTLTENTDYTLSESTFTIINQNLAWSGLNMSYSFLTNKVDVADYAVAEDAELGLAEYGNWFKILVILGIVSLIFTLIFISFGRTGSNAGGIGGSY